MLTSFTDYELANRLCCLGKESKAIVTRHWKDALNLDGPSCSFVFLVSIRSLCPREAMGALGRRLGRGAFAALHIENISCKAWKPCIWMPWLPTGIVKDLRCQMPKKLISNHHLPLEGGCPLPLRGFVWCQPFETVKIWEISHGDRKFGRAWSWTYQKKSRDSQGGDGEGVLGRSCQKHPENT